MAGACGDVQASCGLTRIKQALQAWCDGGQPRYISSPTGSRHLVSVPTGAWTAQSALGTTGDRPPPGTVRARRWSRMAPRAPTIVLTSAERQQLSAWARAGTTPQRLARRARVILGSAAGQSNCALAQQERVSRALVQRWRARF